MMRIEPPGRAQLMAGGNHVKFVDRLVKDVEEAWSRHRKAVLRLKAAFQSVHQRTARLHRSTHVVLPIGG